MQDVKSAPKAGSDRDKKKDERSQVSADRFGFSNERLTFFSYAAFGRVACKE